LAPSSARAKSDRLSRDYLQKRPTIQNLRSSARETPIGRARPSPGRPYHPRKLQRGDTPALHASGYPNTVT
jgi:hypothetical protein